MADIEIAKKSDLDTKADINHNHDDKYALISHTHNEYATKEELNSKADIDHNHDDKYALLDHTHSYNELTDKPEIPRIDNLVTEEAFNALIDKVNNLELRLEALESQEDIE